jgi:hypothetical protein
MLREFQATFDEWVETAKAEQKHTVTIYQEKLLIALAYGTWADLRSDEIVARHLNLEPV